MEELAPTSLPRPLRIAAVAFAGLVLFTTFLYRGFPYDRLGPILERRVEQATGMRLSVGGVSSDLQLLGPGLAFENLRARLDDGRVQTFSRLRVRPAWSTAWLTGKPALAVDAESAAGSLDGVVTLGSTRSFEGELSGVDLASLGLESFAEGISLEGLADLTLSIRFAESGPEGPVRLVARSGTLTHPALPMPIPYEEIQGEFVLGGDTAVRIESLSIASSLGEGAIDGSVGHATRADGAPLDLQIELKAAPAVQSVLRAQGVRLAADGTTKLRVAGTTTSPLVR